LAEAASGQFRGLLDGLAGVAQRDDVAVSSEVWATAGIFAGNFGESHPLRESFNTSDLLNAVYKMDSIRYRIDGLRDELLKLHTMPVS